jgi:hypothetical protein
MTENFVSFLCDRYANFMKLYECFFCVFVHIRDTVDNKFNWEAAAKTAKK